MYNTIRNHMTRLFQATVVIPTQDASIAGDTYLEKGAISVTISDDPTHPHQSQLTVMALQRGWFKRAGITESPVVVRNSEWKYTTHDNRPAVQLTDKIWVTSSLTTPATETVPGININLDPRDAFGDGYHPTTQLCARHLSTLTSAASFDTALDVGTGTGILAILASKLGISSVDAIDIDPASVRKTRRNAKTNHAKITVFQGDVLTWEPSIQYEIVIANLLTGIIENCLSRLLDWVHPGGFLILSGVSDQWKNNVTALIYRHHHIATVTEQDGWCGFLIQKSRIAQVIDIMTTSITTDQIDDALNVCDHYIRYPSPSKARTEINDIVHTIHRYRNSLHHDHPFTLHWNQMIQNLAGCLAWIITSDTTPHTQMAHANALLNEICHTPDPYDPDRTFVPQSALLFKAYNEAKPDTVKLWVPLSNLFAVDFDSGHWAIGYLPVDAGGPTDPNRRQRQRCFSILFDAMRQSDGPTLEAAFTDYIRPIGALLGLISITTPYSQVPNPLADINDT